MELFGYIFLVMIFPVFGILLYLPLRWWAKRKLRDISSENELKMHITSAGIAWVTLIVFALLIGFLQESISPRTEFGRFISTFSGKVYYIVNIFLLSIILGLILQKLGFKLFKKKDNDE